MTYTTNLGWKIKSKSAGGTKYDKPTNKQITIIVHHGYTVPETRGEANELIGRICGRIK